MDEIWKRLKPKDVSKWINFDAKDPAWTYAPGGPVSMASLQSEGVAHLWNLLSKHRVALLADEVGMGKTFQALGVAALLWRKKRNAKILVMAPNRDICAHWQREFSAFTRFHYRKADGLVKALADGKPVPPVETHFRLRDLVSAIEDRMDEASPQLYLTTIHSLSGLVDSGGGNEDRTTCASKTARSLHNRILRKLGGQGFDFVIIDEAHYFRNRNGGSQRVAAAKEFFGGPENRVAERALLLTATPGHTQLGDVANILSYFVANGAGALDQPADKLMRMYALRRFRRMAGKNGSYTKHQYRREITTPCRFGDSPQDEMFFALYQRRLIRDQGFLDEKRRVLYGYLEGFESAGVEDRMHADEDLTEDVSQDDERARDFRAAADTQLLQEMSRDFRSLLGRAPDHPKYGGLVDQCMPLRGLFPIATHRPLHEDKHLVFVRRIPSVRELTKRINERYDEMLAEHLCAALNWSEDDLRRWRDKNWSRDFFNEIAGFGDNSAAEADDADDGGGDSDGQDAQDSYLGSRISDLFVTKKAIDGKEAAAPTDCSRFSLSLRKSTSVFAMFMEPASDYMAGGYDSYFQFSQGGKLRLDYTKAAQVQRMRTRCVFPKETVKALPPRDAKTRNYEQPVETLWSLVFQHLTDDHKSTLCRWATERPDIAENFGNYVKAGFLFASPVVVELYGWHVRFQQALPRREQHSNVQRRYRKFVRYVRQRIAGSLSLQYFAAALDSFEQLCDKIIDHDVGDWAKGWRTLTTLSSPAWYASGDSSHRQHLILGFNSPFYPNTLVATSVFQEGVNLHLQCRKVHHYGIAWTPGDNEQRVGRIDRLFGKINKLLMEEGSDAVTLDVNYPYLKDSFDEDQVGSFIERKHEVEEKMDRCTASSFDKEVRMTRPGWQEFLRQPGQGSNVEDPYPALFDHCKEVARRT